MKNRGRFTPSKAKAKPIPLDQLGLDKLATSDPNEARAFIAKVQTLKLLNANELKAIFYLQSKGARVRLEQSPDVISRALFSIETSFIRVEHAAPGVLEIAARDLGMTSARILPIRFMKTFFPALESGSKTETRRTSESWAKAQAGDLLRVLSPNAEYPRGLFRVLDVRRERLQSISEDSVRREGIEVRDNDAIGSFRQVWDELHRSAPSELWEADPSVFAIRFGNDETEVVRALREVIR
ncbi:yqfb-like protein [Caudoviricetes sp.]|nr:yqfb-like protein [Caudoviricetes sp.]